MARQPSQHFTLFPVSSQQIHVAFEGGRIVSDAGLLAVHALEKPLRVIADLGQRLPDPCTPKFIEHSAEALLTQTVYQILAGYPDCNDAQQLRDDPLFQILADVSPDSDNPLASGSTLARFQYAYTRRQAELPPEERPVLQEVRAAQTGRIKILNDYLVDLFIRTRRTPPAEIILDSACGFCVNAFRLLVHTLAYVIVVLFREAAAAVLEVATASVGTLRQRLWKVGAVVVMGARRIAFHFSQTWPYRGVWCRVLSAVNAFVAVVASG